MLASRPMYESIQILIFCLYKFSTLLYNILYMHLAPVYTHMFEKCYILVAE